MPEPAVRAEVGLPLALDARDQGGVQGVALAPVASFAETPELPLLFPWLLQWRVGRRPAGNLTDPRPVEKPGVGLALAVQPLGVPEAEEHELRHVLVEQPLLLEHPRESPRCPTTLGLSPAKTSRVSPVTMCRIAPLCPW